MWWRVRGLVLGAAGYPWRGTGMTELWGAGVTEVGRGLTELGGAGVTEGVLRGWGEREGAGGGGGG